MCETFVLHAKLNPILNLLVVEDHGGLLFTAETSFDDTGALAKASKMLNIYGTRSVISLLGDLQCR